jgi:hypothetical protein
MCLPAMVFLAMGACVLLLLFVRLGLLGFLVIAVTRLAQLLK